MFVINYSSVPLVLSTSMVGPATVIIPGARTWNVKQGVLKTQHGDVACIDWSPYHRTTNTKAFSFKTSKTQIEVFDRPAEPAKCLKENDKIHRRPHPTAMVRVVNLTAHIIAISDLLIPPLCQRRIRGTSTSTWAKIPHKFKPMVDNVEFCSRDGLVLQIEPAC